MKTEYIPIGIDELDPEDIINLCTINCKLADRGMPAKDRQQLIRGLAQHMSGKSYKGING